MSSPWTKGFIYFWTAFSLGVSFDIQVTCYIDNFLAPWAITFVFLANISSVLLIFDKIFFNLCIFLHLFLTCLKHGVEAAAPRCSPTKTHMHLKSLVKKSCVSRGLPGRAGLAELLAWEGRGSKTGSSPGNCCCCLPYVVVPYRHSLT